MLGEKHDLHEEFPEFSDLIHQLKIKDRHFQHLFEKYNTINKEVLRMEAEAEPVADEILEAEKKKRLLIKDEIYQYLKEKSAS